VTPWRGEIGSARLFSSLSGWQRGFRADRPEPSQADAGPDGAFARGRRPLDTVYWGPGYEDDEIRQALDSRRRASRARVAPGDRRADGPRDSRGSRGRLVPGAAPRGRTSSSARRTRSITASSSAFRHRPVLGRGATGENAGLRHEEQMTRAVRQDPLVRA